MADVQTLVEKILNGLVERGSEGGLQVAAYHRGRLVVNACAGMARPGGPPVSPTTLFPVFSTTKGIAATAVLRLVERGQLYLDEPLAAAWPGFATNGKEKITLRMALNHSAGLPHMPPCEKAEELVDWARMCARVAELKPLWAPGTKTYYHAITFSWLVGEPARLARGQDFSQIIQEEIVEPLGLQGMLYVGQPDFEEPRVALLEKDPRPPPPQNPAGAPDPVAALSIPPMVCPLEDWMNRLGARRGCIPASNGVMTATAVAAHYGALVGEVNGVRLLSEETLEAATTPAMTGEEPALTRGLGYGLSGPASQRGLVFGHGGAGGSNGMADRRHQLAIGFAKTRMGTSDGEEKNAFEQIREAIYSALNLT